MKKSWILVGIALMCAGVGIYAFKISSGVSEAVKSAQTAVESATEHHVIFKCKDGHQKTVKAIYSTKDGQYHSESCAQSNDPECCECDKGNSICAGHQGLKPGSWPDYCNKCAGSTAGSSSSSDSANDSGSYQGYQPSYQHERL